MVGAGKKIPSHLLYWIRGVLAVLMVLTAFLVSTTVFAQARIVRVGVYQNEPKVFTDAQGQPSGIFIDLIKEIARKEGWTLEYQIGTWDEDLKALENGQIDLMPDVAYSEERGEKYDFHPTPVAESWSYVYVPSRSRADNVTQLNGKRVAVLGGSIQETIFTQMVNGFGLRVAIVPASSLKEAFQMVADNKVDAAIANHLFGDYFNRKYGLSRTPIVFNEVKLYFATAKGRNSDLLTAIDRHLNEWISDQGSVYYQVLNRYTTKQSLGIVPKWVWWAAGVIAGLLVIASGIILLLRWQVRLQTRHLLEANQKLKESELKYRTLFNCAGEAIFLMRADRFVDCNAQTLAMFGCEREQIIGESPYKFSPPLQPGGRPSKEKAMEKINQALTEGPQSFEWEHCRENGVSFPAEVKLNRLELGGEVYLQAIVRDITERKKTEELKNQFLSITSHELKTPLIPIKSQCQLLLAETYGSLNQEQKEALEMIGRNESHMERLVNDVLDIASARSENMQLIREDADISKIISDSMEIVKEEAKRKGITLHLKKPAALSKVFVDPQRIFQVVANLLNNALKYTPENGTIDITVSKKKDCIQVSVKDSGIGMNNKILGKLFTPFFQADSKLDRKYGGTGLGLSICKGIIEAHGGKIWGESEGKDKGSTFTFTLSSNKSKQIPS